MPTASEHTPELTAVDLSCIRAERVLFQKLSFTLPAGKLMLVLGANGSGKTSLLRILAGLSAPVEGQVRWNRGPLAASRRDIHYIGHLNGIKEALTPRENLIVAGALMASERNSKVDQAITWCGLDAVSDVPAAALSSGQRRRVAIARLALTPARLWVLDEPLTALDDAGKSMVRDLLQTHVQDGGAAVLATHEALQLDGQIAVKLEL
jgi:heme exporter protein A